MARKKKTVRRSKSAARKRTARAAKTPIATRRRPRRKVARRSVAAKAPAAGAETMSIAELQAELEARLSTLHARKAELEAELAEIDAALSGSAPVAGSGGTTGRKKTGRKKTTRKKAGGTRKVAKKTTAAKAGGSRKKAGSRRGGGRAKGAGGKNLAESLYEVLKGKEMKVAELIDAVKAAGYTSNSPNFRVMVSGALSKNKGTMFKSVSRGVYTTVG
ncbi:MAG: hypothetical protein ACYTEV_04575 [Planctomycetota bacterium]|jgi:hypothetical protein